MLSYLSIKEQMKARLGELWWYTLVVLVVSRFGDLINAIIGLWLVPKYVPPEELGALLPLASIGGMLGFPLIIVAIPLMKFLSKYMALGEYGKVKRLLVDMIFIMTGLFVVVALLGYWVFPFVFVRMRVTEGRLGMLIIMFGLIGSMAPVFNTAMQGLKKFKMMSILGFTSAVVRLITMLVCLPIRGLSGYFVGQTVPLFYGIGAALIVLRKHLSRNVKMMPYWEEDWRSILKYTWYTALYTISWNCVISVEQFVIRHRLPDIESAGFYMISRFAEITQYIGLTSAMVLFPIASMNHEVGGVEPRKMLTQSLFFSLLGGALCILVIVPLVGFLFSVKQEWNRYQQFIPQLIFFSIACVLRGSTCCFITYQTARSQFCFVPLFTGINIAEIVLLYVLTGYGYFNKWLPKVWFEKLTEFNPCRLSVIVSITLIFSLVLFLNVLWRLRSNNKVYE
jgi:O-antigen/teichoic acid export membrane protein